MTVMMNTTGRRARAALYYAGIGSRDTPYDICDRMTRLAERLREHGYTLRSGGARRADTAFARGAGQDAIIYLPWETYVIEETGARRIVCGEDARLRSIAERLHPRWSACGPRARAYLTRKVAQILGTDATDSPSKFVICWTPDARGGGGTGSALRVAASHSPSIPVYDLAEPNMYEFLMDHFAEEPTRYPEARHGPPQKATPQGAARGLFDVQTE